MKKLEIPDHKKEMVIKWEKKLSALFGSEIPTDAEWNVPADIARVFQAMQGSDAHIFLPGSGSEELQSSRVTAEGLLEWSGDDDSLDRYAFVVKPVRLTFWNPGSQTHEANFVLEVGAMPTGCPSGYATEVGVEECVELSKGNFVPRAAWDSGEYNGKDLPTSARLVCRATRPARFALFGKGSLYNSFRDRDFDASMDHHTDPVEFAKIVSEMASIEIA